MSMCNVGYTVRLNTGGGFIDGVLWAVDLMDLSSGIFWPLTLLCWWTVRGSFNIHTVALQVLSEINGVVKDECPLDQEWISQTVGALRFCPRASTRPLIQSVQITIHSILLFCLSCTIGESLSQVRPLPPLPLSYSWIRVCRGPYPIFLL